MRPVVVTDWETGRVSRSKVNRQGSSCSCGKQAYTSKKIAKATAKAQSRATGEDIEAYHCYAGHCFHIGHRPGSERRPPRMAS